MAGFFKKVVGFFTFGEDYVSEEEYYDEEEYLDEEEEDFDEEDYAEDEPVLRVVSREPIEEESVLVGKPTRADCKHVEYAPFSFEDMSHVVDVLKAGKAVILKLAELDDDFRQRVIDFTCGVVCSLQCICDMPTDDVCILIPNDADAFGID